MIPIIWFFVAWLATMGVFFLLALMTMGIALRFGLSDSKMNVFCALFFIVPVVIFGAVGIYGATSVDWSQTINLIPSPSTNSFLLP